MQERASTGRVYIANVDHMNDHGAFVPEIAPVHQSNLCMEITLPTKPLAFTDDPNGEIALCTLSAFKPGRDPHVGLTERRGVLRCGGTGLSARLSGLPDGCCRNPG